MAVQLITMEDLRIFKQEMLSEIKKILLKHPPESEKKWLKSREAQKMLGLSAATLRSLREKGALPFTKIGGTIYYAADDIRKMLEQNKFRARY